MVSRGVRYLLVATAIFGIYYLHILAIPTSVLSPMRGHDSTHGQPSTHGADVVAPIPDGANLAPTPVASTENVPAHVSEGNTAPAAQTSEATGHFIPDVWGAFREDIMFEQAKIDFTKYAKYQPHFYDGKPGAATFSTYLCTRNASIHDPYFAATQQLVYRNLWSPASASKKHPFTVFVAPFVPAEQREILSGQGAIIRELDLVDWNPTIEVNNRWRDQFSKLHMWNQTGFSRIANMDSDAFPISNVDDIFDLATRQRCHPDMVDPEDAALNGGICDYVMTAAPDLYITPDGHPAFNGGLLILEPNPAMHARLLRNYPKMDKYDVSLVEQAFLNWQFGQESAYPAHMLERAYNGVSPQEEDAGKLKIIHEKLWAGFGPSWSKTLFKDNWKEMLAFYDSDTFKYARELDGLRTAFASS